jgi:hypothetical protein
MIRAVRFRRDSDLLHTGTAFFSQMTGDHGATTIPRHTYSLYHSEDSDNIVMIHYRDSNQEQQTPVGPMFMSMRNA